MTLDAIDAGRRTFACALRQAGAAAHLVRTHRTDALMAAALGAAAVAFAEWRFRMFDLAILDSAPDLWFEADANRVIEANASRYSEMHFRTTVHPLYALFVSLPMVVLRHFGLSFDGAAAATVAAGAFLFTATFYVSARSLALRPLDAAVTTGLMLSTSGAMFWLPMPETLAFAGASMLVPLVWLAVRRGEHDLVTAPLQSLISLSMTVTNWMSGLAASALGLGLRRALRISIVVLLLAAGLSIVQRGLFPHAGMPFDVQGEADYVVLAPDYILHRLYTFVAEPFLAPTPVEAVDGSGAHLVNFGTPGGTPFFWLAATGWLVLAGLAVEALRKGVVSPHIAVFALFVLDGEFVLHILYGDGFFLYALNFVPLLVLLASTACVGRRRRLALAVAIATALLSGAHNLAQLDRATDLLNHLQVPRAQLP